jgi:vacuolar protein sorting-associated protein 13A/C
MRKPLPVKLIRMGDWFDVDPLIKHYMIQGGLEAYKVLGSFEYMGAPVGLIRGGAKGIADSVYEPAKGAVRGPKQFGRGVKKGAVSLLRGTAGGVFNSASDITHSVGQGVAALTVSNQKSWPPGPSSLMCYVGVNDRWIKNM